MSSCMPPWPMRSAPGSARPAPRCRAAIGGGISAADALLPAIQTELDDLFARCPVFPMLEPELVRCRYGNDANMIGALKLFFERNPA